jgi:hypothetical protein
MKRRVDDEPRDDVRQDVAPQQGRRGRAQRPGGADVLGLAKDQHRAADHPGHRRDTPHADRDRRVQRAGAHRRDDRESQQEIGKGEQDLDPAHHHRIEPAAGEAGDRSEHEPAGQRNQHGHHTDQQRDTRAVDHARENVATELVGAEPVFRARL